MTEPSVVACLPNMILVQASFSSESNLSPTGIPTARETKIPKKPVFVSADIGLIQRVLENLLDNAIKYTPEGGQVEIALNIGDLKIETVVKDSGLGISTDEAQHIFERFYRIEKHRDQDGTGLGLAIVKRIIQLHNSSIFVSPAKNSGTEFSFDLPSAVM